VNDGESPLQSIRVIKLMLCEFLRRILSVQLKYI
jgi:hypothetical protein